MPLQRFQEEADLLSFKAGQPIFILGQPGDTMYVVVEGEVELSLNGKPIDTILAGGIFGELALIDDSPRIATATAKTACKLAAVNQQQFIFLVRNTPHFAIQVMKTMAERLRRETMLRYK
jgi:CRP/FNR family transcriptional regulator, cyclic AMP receptor protein